jgi:hypothetical protein
MGDKRRQSRTAVQIVEARPDLQLKQLRIQLNEKVNQAENVSNRIDYLQNVEVPKLSLELDVAHAEIENIKADIRELARDVGETPDDIQDAEVVAITNQSTN